MRHFGWAFASSLLVMTTSLVACYPEFQFGGGDGGQGGAPTSTARVGVGPNSSSSGETSASSSSSSVSTTSTGGMMASTSTGPAPPQVGCGPANGQTLTACEPNEDCCFHKTNAGLDTCSPNGCSSDFITFSCNGPDDCPNGQLCCATFDEDWFGSYFTGPITCATQCPNPSMIICETNADCVNGGSCQSVFNDAGYNNEYLGCR